MDDDAAARRARRAVDRRRRCINLPFTDDARVPRAAGSSRSSSVGERRHRRHVGRRPGRAARRSSPSWSPLVGIVARPTLVYQRQPASKAGRAASVLANAWYYDQAVTAFVGGPGSQALRRRRLVRPQRHRRRGQRRRRARARRPAAGCAALQTGLRAQLRRSASASAPCCCSAWFVDPGGCCLMLPPSRRRRLPAPHRARSLVPAVGARRWSRCSPKRRPELVRLVGLVAARGHRRADASGCSSQFDTGDAGFQFVVAAHVDRGVGHPLAPRRRRHLAVPGRAHRRAVPDRDRSAPTRTTTTRRTRLDAAARGRRASACSSPRPVRVLRVLRDRARADVLPHRRLGLRQPRLRGDEVLPVHDVGSAFMLVGIIATVVPRTSGNGSAPHLRPRRDRRAAPTSPPSTARWLFLALRHRVRGQGAAVPVPHVAARRPHRGAHRRLGGPGRRDAEARHLRVPALRRSTCSRRPPTARAAAADPRR